ncbi:conserved hypothetical protein [Luminiphilus syltensis NOR5-1B]|uniref:Amidohydrolase 3 domain-containing protein n=1 Tax=Luminiphilus syltensis NOR5-1B TaxID=565045 RepID=B8KYB9_9GAMM|nr:amidohydrolase family protein [Luminiphilus syltensis]EED36130.1 conserved hypothetical protein [Luminiphilus syltensis NOR5-1B]
MNLRTSLLIVTVFCLGVYVLFAIATRAPDAPEHQVFFNGTVLTMDAANTVAEAVSIRRGTIERVGSSDAILQTVSDDSEVTDLRGRTLIPGFVDAYGDFPRAGGSAVFVDLRTAPAGDIASLDQLLGRLDAYARAREDGWVVGWGLEASQLEQPERLWLALDRSFPDRPVAIIPGLGAGVLVNGAALRELGLESRAADYPDTISGTPATSVAGPLEGAAAASVIQHVYELDWFDRIRVTTAAARWYAERGVTTVSAAAMPMSWLESLGWLSRFNVFPQRVLGAPSYAELSAVSADKEQLLASLQNGRLVIPRVSIGFLEQETPLRDDFTLREQLIELYSYRTQPLLRSVSQAEMQQALNAIEASADAHPWPDARPVILIPERMDTAGTNRQTTTTASFIVTPGLAGINPLGADNQPDSEQRDSEEKTGSVPEPRPRFSLRMSIDAGRGEPLDVISPVTGVVSRESALSPLDTLRALTIDPAGLWLIDDRIGSIEVGKAADLVVLSGNPLIKSDSTDVVVEETLVGGAVIYSRR